MPGTGWEGAGGGPGPVGTSARPAAVTGTTAGRPVPGGRAHRGCPAPVPPATTKAPLAPPGPVPRALAPHPPEARVLPPSLPPAFGRPSAAHLALASEVPGTAPPRPYAAGGGSDAAPAESSPGRGLVPGDTGPTSSPVAVSSGSKYPESRAGPERWGRRRVSNGRKASGECSPREDSCILGSVVLRVGR